MVRKYTEDYPDLESDGSAAGGSLSFSVFLNRNGISESETLDYRPNACGTPPYRCTGQVLFQKSGNQAGHLLIADVFGTDVLEDFLQSQPVRSIKHYNDVTAFYSGKRFNYSTWVHSEPDTRKIRSISHFTVLAKNDADLKQRIMREEFCSKPRQGFDPLCDSP